MAHPNTVNDTPDIRSGTVRPVPETPPHQGTYPMRVVAGASFSVLYFAKRIFLALLV